MKKVDISEEVKIQLFTEVLKYETEYQGVWGVDEKDLHDDFVKGEAAFLMLEILGIGKEYIDWSFGKEYDVYKKAVVEYKVC